MKVKSCKTEKLYFIYKQSLAKLEKSFSSGDAITQQESFNPLSQVVFFHPKVAGGGGGGGVVSTLLNSAN